MLRTTDLSIDHRITVATLFSFLSALLASTGRFCYSAITSGAIVMILPVRASLLEKYSTNHIPGFHRALRFLGNYVS